MAHVMILRFNIMQRVFMMKTKALSVATIDSRVLHLAREAISELIQDVPSQSIFKFSRDVSDDR
ncbi:MAG: hypothetical protein ACSLEL_05050 [Candidatus Malihini olakiniferum]